MSTRKDPKKGYKEVRSIKQLLKARNQASQKRLNDLFSTVGDNPEILWYPSAGNDYRDILELSEIDENNIRGIRGNINIVTDYGIPAPDLFIHTDYNKKMVKLKKGEVFNDGKTNVVAKKIYPLCIDASLVKYEVNEESVVDKEEAPKTPEIYLLDIEITSNKLGKIEKPVIYFLFENINFFQEVLLRHGINVAYMVKVREGCGKGGNRKSVTNIYPYFSVLNTRYLIADNEIHFDTEDLKAFLSKGLELKDYELKELTPRRQIAHPIRWSDFQVHVYEVIIKENLLTKERIEEIYRPIQESWERECSSA